LKKSIELGALNCLSYFVLTADIRSVSQANILAAVVINMTVALLSFSILKRLQEAKTLADRVLYAVGGTIGTVIGIVVTKAVFGQ
jgi:hypothetical protein